MSSVRLEAKVQSMSAQRCALVTGATGFIGRALVIRLQAEGWRVIAAGRGESASRLPAGVEQVVPFDLRGSDVVELPGGIDTIFHLAGKAHALAEVAQDEGEYALVNTVGTRRLLEAGARAGTRAFVYFSTVKAIGEVSTENQAADESWDPPPETAYGRSKRDAEQLVLAAGAIPHRVVLRPSLVYGPGAKGNLEKMIAAVAAGRFPPLPEVGNRRSMIHLDDVCSATIVAASHPAAKGRVYILTDGVPVSTRQLFVWMSEALHRRVPGWTVPLWVLRLLGGMGSVIGRLRGRRFVFDTDALTKLTTSAWYDSSRIGRELEWHPRHTLRSALPEIVRAAVGRVSASTEKS